MDSLDSVRCEILRLVKARRNTAFVRTQQLSRLCNVPEKRIRKELAELAQEKIVLISGWDGRQMRPIEAWSSPDEFIESRMEGGYLRIEICAVS
jgi:hypothetical protein